MENFETDIPQETDAEWRLRKMVEILQNRRDELLESLTHTYQDGRVIQCRESDEQPIRNAIERMQRSGLTKQLWRMADNTSALVTVDELHEAIVSGQDQGAQVWSDFMRAAEDASVLF